MAESLVVPEYSEPSAVPPSSAIPEQQQPSESVGVKAQVRVGGLAPRAAAGAVLVLVVFVLIASMAGGSGDQSDGDATSDGSVSGSTCVTINPCDSNPCIHGSCSADDIRSVADLSNQPVCTCEVGWGGSRCDQALATLENAAVGGGWFLVRRTVGAWHPADDDLAGTAEYGTYERNPNAASTFSVAFDGLTMPNGRPFDQYLFASGDLSMWAIMDRSEVGDCQEIMATGGSGTGNGGWNPTVKASSDTTEPTTPLQYCRSYCCDEDPWISVRVSPFR